MQTKRNDIKVKIYDCSNSIYTDQTGCFPINSCSHYKYIMVLCEIDGNQILMEPMVDRKDHNIVAAFEKLIGRLKGQGIYPKHQFMDNEASELYKNAMKEANMTFHFATPHMHLANIVHQKSFRVYPLGVDDLFPLNEWDMLLPQAEMTLNMLRPANVSPYMAPMIILQSSSSSTTWLCSATLPTPRKLWIIGDSRSRRMV